MKIQIFWLLVISLATVQAIDVEFPATKLITRVIFSFSSAYQDPIAYYFNKVGELLNWCTDCQKGHFKPIQLSFLQYNVSKLLIQADPENTTAAMVVLVNINDFLMNATLSLADSPNKECGSNTLCNITQAFSKLPDNPLVKLNLLVVSDLCPPASNFDEYFASGIKKFSNGPTSSAITTNFAWLMSNYSMLPDNTTCQDHSKIQQFINPGNISNLADYTTYTDKMVNPMLLLDVETATNVVNIFILCDYQNLEYMYDIILDHVYNSTLCGTDTTQDPGKGQMNYFVMAEIKYGPNEYRQAQTVLPFMDYPKNNIDFENYLKYSLETKLASEEVSTTPVPANFKNAFNDIFRSAQSLGGYQFNLVLLDGMNAALEYIEFLTGAKRNLDIIMVNEAAYSLTEQDSKDSPLVDFFNDKFSSNANSTIHYYIINSTDPEQFENIGACKSELPASKFKLVKIGNIAWYIYATIGVAALTALAIIGNIIYWKFIRKRYDPIAGLAKQFELTAEERELLSNARDQLYLDEKFLEINYDIILGRGASSTVFEATIKGIAPLLKNEKTIENAHFHDCIVAAKIPNQFRGDQIEQMIAEIEAAKALGNHQNICTMLGWSSPKRQPCLLFEPMEMDFLSYIKSLRIIQDSGLGRSSQRGSQASLRSGHGFETIALETQNLKIGETDKNIGHHSDLENGTEDVNAEEKVVFTVPQFTAAQHKTFLQILWQGARALDYIASKKLVHRDVAARNFLLSQRGNTYIAKIADFGLSGIVDEETNVYVGDISKRLPIKWLSIEALVDKIFSEASDVWAFGITLIEVYSCAGELYAGVPLTEVIDYLKNGKRMDKVEQMPNEIYEIAVACWQEAPDERPTFKMLEEKLYTMLMADDPDYYLDLVKSIYGNAPVVVENNDGENERDYED